MIENFLSVSKKLQSFFVWQVSHFISKGSTPEEQATLREVMIIIINKLVNYPHFLLWIFCYN
jgi:hypothetical protein